MSHKSLDEVGPRRRRDRLNIFRRQQNEREINQLPAGLDHVENLHG